MYIEYCCLLDYVWLNTTVVSGFSEHVEGAIMDINMKSINNILFQQ